MKDLKERVQISEVRRSIALIISGIVCARMARMQLHTLWLTIECMCQSSMPTKNITNIII